MLFFKIGHISLCRIFANMTDEQTLVIYSGHPMAYFFNKNAPRVSDKRNDDSNYSKQDDWEKYNALGVTQFDNDAGSFMYIGPQGIVHGTNIIIKCSKKSRF